MTTPAQKAMYKYYELESLKSANTENWCKINSLAKQGQLTVSDLKSLIRLQKSVNIASYKLLETLERRYKSEVLDQPQ